MMNRKMKQLALAVGMALGGMGMLPSAEAVSVSADNLGQVLIFPFYTVRGGWTSLFGVTNTSDRVVAVKVRFHEALNSRDVFDFVIILSPKDLWTGWLEDNPTTGPLLKTQDASCTVGIIPAAGQPFNTTAFTAPGASDGGPTTVDRLREGYVEMIMMGAANATPNALAAGAIHTNSVVSAAGCANLNAAFKGASPYTPATGLAAVQGAFPNYIVSPLKGTFSLVNQTPGTGYNAVGLPTALNNFRTAPFVTLQAPPGPNVTLAQSGYEPTLAAATTTGVYYDASNDQPVNGAANGAAAVTDALLVSNILNEWSRRDNPELGWVTRTDWVITFPTKQFYADNNGSVYGGRAAGRAGLPNDLAPFSQYFWGRSCDPIAVSLYNREEKAVEDTGFSPWVTPQLCYEANVITFNPGALLTANQVLASPNTQAVSYPDPDQYGNRFLYGWMNVGFTPALPGVGFAITSRSSPDSALLREAALYDHSYIRPVPVR